MSNYRDLGITDPNIFGRKRGNSYVKDNYLLEIEHEDTLDTPVSLDYLKISSSDGETLTNIVIDGVTYTFSSAVDATKPIKIKTVIRETLEVAHDAARAAKTMTDMEVYPKIAVVYDGTDTYIYHLGHLTVASVNDGSSDLAFTRKSTQFLEAEYSITFTEGASVSVTDGTTTVSSVDCTDAATAATSLATALTTLGITHNGIELEDDSTEITGKLYLGGKDLTLTINDGTAVYTGSSVINFK